METVTIKKRINWEELLGANPREKSKKILIFMGSNSQKYITKIQKSLIGSEEYIMIHKIDPQVEEILIKSKRSELLLEVKYNKKTNEGYKKVNYKFYKIITYFLVQFFGERLKADQEFQAIKECLKENEIISLEISECSI